MEEIMLRLQFLFVKGEDKDLYQLTDSSQNSQFHQFEKRLPLLFVHQHFGKNALEMTEFLLVLF